MAEDTLSSEFYWENIILKVEDKLFCVPLSQFVQSSQIFADMFLLPSGPAARSEGQDREHPIVLDGYKKDEFTSLLRVMHPTTRSLISGLRLKKGEWVSVLKLSTIWNMKEIRQYAIHRLSTDIILSPIEKILLAREHRISTWLDEALNSLASGDPKPSFEDLAILGWETTARLLWIWYNLSGSPINSNVLYFRRDAIKCGFCLSSSSLIDSDHGCNHCGHILSADAELTFLGRGSPRPGIPDRMVAFLGILCRKCGEKAFNTKSFSCGVCSTVCGTYSEVRVPPTKRLDEMIEEMFGEEIQNLVWLSRMVRHTSP